MMDELSLHMTRVSWGDGCDAQVYTVGNPSKTPLILLHGFMQDGRSWAHVARQLTDNYYVLMPDLVGHGITVMPDAAEQGQPHMYSLTNQVAEVDAIVDELCGGKKPVLVGYSMGGRVAAQYVVAHPTKLRALVLESAGLGFINPEDAQATADKNEKLAQRLEDPEQDFSDFVDFWEDLPLFDTQKKLDATTQFVVREGRLENDPFQLALSLRYAGQQHMHDLRPALMTVDCPILYLAGGEDAKYKAVAQSLVAQMADALKNAENEETFPQIQVEIVPGVGHNIHLETPDTFTKNVERFLALHAVSFGL